MKEIHYNGGIVVFRVPDTWREETYRDGGASYYPPGSDHGSLYVTLTTARQSGPVDANAFRDLANTGRHDGDAVAELLSNGNYLRRFERQQAVEERKQHTVFWMLCNLVPPNTARIALFNYGVPENQAADPSQSGVVAMLDQEIRNARFTHLTPEEVAAAQRAAKPWWRFW